MYGLSSGAIFSYFNNPHPDFTGMLDIWRWISEKRYKTDTRLLQPLTVESPGDLMKDDIADNLSDQ